MKKIFALTRVVIAVLFIATAARAQDVSINVITQENGINDGSWALNATGTTILVTVCNEDLGTTNVPVYKLRPLISIPGAIVQLAPSGSQTGLPAGWTILANTGNSIRLSNGTDNFAPGECRDIVLLVTPIAVGGPLTVTGTMAYSTGVAPGNASGTQTTGNDPSNDNSTTAVVITAPAAVPPTATDDVSATNDQTNVTITVPGNDTPGSAVLNPATVMLIDPTDGTTRVTSVTIPGEGTYTVDPVTGAVVFDPVPGFSGGSTVKYTIKDVNGVESNQATITVTVVLPVTLVSFDVTKEGKSALLNWATTEETNSDHFEIQHSLNGKNWQKVGQVASNGESSTMKKYSFYHTNPVNGDNLYRLKMIDKDQTFAFSRIQSVKFEGIVESDLSVYPNPLADKLFIRDFTTVKNVNITDLAGRTVYESDLVSKGTGEINVKSLAQGMYVVKVIRTNGTLSTHKVIVKK